MSYWACGYNKVLYIPEHRMDADLKFWYVNNIDELRLPDDYKAHTNNFNVEIVHGTIKHLKELYGVIGYFRFRRYNGMRTTRIFFYQTPSPSVIHFFFSMSPIYMPDLPKPIVLKSMETDNDDKAFNILQDNLKTLRSNYDDWKFYYTGAIRRPTRDITNLIYTCLIEHPALIFKTGYLIDLTGTTGESVGSSDTNSDSELSSSDSDSDSDFIEN